MAFAALRKYHQETRRPIYSALLVLPFLLIYELGGLILGLNVINGGDALLRRLLDALLRRMLGESFAMATFASTLVLLVCFVVWQWRTKARWDVDPSRLALLFTESLAFALLLRFFMGWLAPVLATGRPALCEGCSLGHVPNDFFANLVLFCGAGVYEELVFRVLLLELLVLVFTKLLHLEPAYAAAWAVITGALLFSFFHYVGPSHDAWALNGFLQRAFAGVFFAALYVTRCFGVAAASHALYDILVGSGF